MDFQDMSQLSQRLARLRESGLAPKVRDSANRKRSIIPPESGWSPLADDVWERRVVMPAILPEKFEDPFVLTGTTRSEDLVFYDLETTGLSGGAGNIAFLIGIGRQFQGEFVVTQLFLADYPGEPAMLERYRDLSGTSAVQVSYNGRSFDSQVLKTRFLLNRMPPVFPPQVDLLYPSRRMWSPLLPNVALGTLETEVLGFHRMDDLPGREAPDAWFEWLDGDDGRIGGVFRHNADDIQSLAALLLRIEQWGDLSPETLSPGSVSDGGHPDGLPPSFYGMARQYSLRNPARSRRWLEAGWSAGDTRCGRELAVILKREGNHAAARRIWEKLNSEGMDYLAAVELAKDNEHRLKDFSSALALITVFDRWPLTPRHRREMNHRRGRLERRLEREQSR
jgi:uncharacterized protein YprB with RNaseH-like and TPR domain